MLALIGIIGDMIYISVKYLYNTVKYVTNNREYMDRYLVRRVVSKYIIYKNNLETSL